MSDKEIERLRKTIEEASRRLSAAERRQQEQLVENPVPTRQETVDKPLPATCVECRRQPAAVEARQVQDLSRPPTGWLGLRPSKTEYHYKYPMLMHLKHSLGPFCEGCAERSRRAEEERRKEQDRD